MKKFGLSLLLGFVLFTHHVKAQAQPDEYASPVITFAINAYDMEESLEFYTSILGMNIVDEFTIDSNFGLKSGLSNGVPFHVKVLRLTDDPNSAQIKITSFENQTLTKDEFIQDKIGVQYLTILVKNLDPFIERIRTNNIEFRGDTPIPLGKNQRFVLIQDPNGLFIELIGK